MTSAYRSGVAGAIEVGELLSGRPRNEEVVLQTIRCAGALPAREIAQRSGLPRPSVDDAIRDLVDKRWLDESEPVIRGRGRPARHYRFRAECGHVAGLDVGAHTVRAVVTDLAGGVGGRSEVAVAPQDPRSVRMDAVAAALDAAVADAELTRDQVWAATAGSTGLLSSEGLVEMSSAIPDWAGVDLTRFLGTLISGPTAADVDVRLAALAERMHGVAVGVDDLVFLQAGRRTGLATVLGGRVLRGHFGGAGDYSCLPVEWSRAVGYLTSCRARPSRPTGDPLIDTVVAASEGRTQARRAVTRYARAAAVVAAMVVAIADPQTIVIGGGLSHLAHVWLPEFRSALAEWCRRPTDDVRISALGGEAAAIGAACLALNLVESALQLPDGSRAELTAP